MKRRTSIATTAMVLVVTISSALTCKDLAIDNNRKEPNGKSVQEYHGLNNMDFQANSTGYSLPLDINDIVNFNYISRVIELDSVSNLIRKNGFAIVEPGLYSNIACYDFDSFYWSLDRLRIPALVTIDTGLYLYQAVLDDVLKSIEDPALRSQIWDLKKQPLNVGMFSKGPYTRGLELMARLGSDEAERILIDKVNIGSELHKPRPEKFEKDIDTLDRLDGKANLYWSWLYSMRTLLQQLPDGYPDFMRTQAWQRRQLSSVLASWIQLHDEPIRLTDSTEPGPIAVGVTVPPMPPAPPPIGYVEPVPSLWAQLQSLTVMVSQRIDDLGIQKSEAHDRLSVLEGFFQHILNISAKQLTNKSLESEDREFFEKLPSVLSNLLPGVEKYSLANILEGDTTGIEQAVGGIDLVIVAYPTLDGKACLAIGPVLSYYEFKYPKQGHLTNETWRLMLDSPARPDRPRWYSPLIKQTEDFLRLSRLTSNPFMNGCPDWSPDGKRIVFAGSEEAWTSDIYVMNADGTGRKNLTNHPGIYGSPCWSSDDKKIVFVLYDKGSRGEIYVMDSDGTNQQRLTNNRYHDAKPSWSPDRKRIVFWSDRTGQGDIYVMNADGSEQTRLTDNPAFDGNPCWSPDGKKIAFESDRYGRHFNDDIFVMNTDGTEEIRITNSSGHETSPCWSPDGKQIAFVSDRDGNTEIYVMNADGSEQRRLTNNSVDDGSPCWSPDGKQIVFDSCVFGRGFPDICILCLDRRDK